MSLTGPSRTWRDWVGLATRLVLGLTLIVAGGLKLPRLDVSVMATNAYQLLPFELAQVVGYTLPFVEVIIGVFLVLGLFTRVAAVLGSALMATFIAGIISVWVRGISIDCGCFGGGGAVDAALTQYPAEIARDLGLLACGVWSAVRPRSVAALDAFRAPQIPNTFDDTENELDLDEPDKELVR